MDDDWPGRPLDWPPAPLTDGRVVLDRMTRDDITAIVMAIDDEILRWLPLPDPYAESDAKAFLEWQQDMAARGAGLNFALRLADDARLRGSVGLHFRGGPGVAEIGYWVAPGSRGQGLAAAAIRVLAAHAFERFSPRRVELQIEPANTGSCRAAERAGAQPEGVRRAGIDHLGEPRDAAIYALLPGEV